MNEGVTGDIFANKTTLGPLFLQKVESFSDPIKQTGMCGLYNKMYLNMKWS